MLATTTKRNGYNGTGSANQFAYTFTIFEAADLSVYVTDPTTGIQTLQFYITDYIVSGIGEVGGGLVTFNTAPTAGHRIEIVRNQPNIQQTDVRDQGSAFRSALEDQFDKLVMITQTLQDQLDRSIHLPIGEAGAAVTTELPHKVNRQSGYLGFNGSGELIVVTAVAPATASVTAFAETLLDDASAEAMRDTLGIVGQVDVTIASSPQIDYTGIPATHMYTVARITPSVDPVDLSGITGGDEGQMILLVNVSTTNSIGLLHEDTGSTAANRIRIPRADFMEATLRKFKIPPKGTALLVYDNTSQRWQLASDNTPSQTIHVTTSTRNLSLAEAGGYYTNRTATFLITFNLPSSAVFDGRLVRYTIFCHNAFGVRIVSPSGEKVWMGGISAVGAGALESYTPGSSVTIVYAGANTWQVEAFTGPWDLTI